MCYAENTGDSSDTWIETSIRLALSKMDFIAAHSITHKTVGHIAKFDGLIMNYGGVVAHSAGISIVASHYNQKLPCIVGSIAGAVSDSTHSGPAQSDAAKVVTVNTEGLDASYMYAVCYNEYSIQPSDSNWRDSGIRVSISKIDSILYGPASSSFPVRQ